MTGSSLLTRGKHFFLGDRIGAERLIPAYAGKTRGSATVAGGGPAHPCLRGENLDMSCQLTEIKGSSLLTRGKRILCRCARMGVRLIPAYAGKTRCAGHRGQGRPAHPCLRGENEVHPGDSVVLFGSSLLTRGKRQEVTVEHTTHRLIPAYAGKTTSASVCGQPYTAHPCLRGENAIDTALHTPASGSSLLTRGKPTRLYRKPDVTRLIPAYAGKTFE